MVATDACEELVYIYVCVCVCVCLHLIWKKVPITNCRLFSKIRSKRNNINSHGPTNRTDATEVTQLLRRRREREEAGEEEKKARFALLVLILATLDYHKTRIFIAGTFSRIGTDISI